MIAQRYSSDKKTEWDEFVAQSRNATFLFYRDFMDYHKERFEDYSLMVYNQKGKLVALFPATYHKDIKTIKSHGGLTYGGLLLQEGVGTKDVLSFSQLIVNQYKELCALNLQIRPIPHIYHLHPSEEELYAWHRLGANLSARSASSAVNLSQPLSFSTLRKRQAKKAVQSGCTIDSDGNLEEFWRVLTATLREKHQVSPVHSLAEITILKERFPNQIRCVTVLDAAGKVVGGTLLFCTPKNIHAQYIASNEKGKRVGALDFLFTHLLKEYQSAFQETTQPLYFDFGISTEEGGLILNEGLIAQKEGFGASTIVYDEYVIDLKP